MSEQTQEPEVKDVERVEIQPAAEENDDEEKETPTESSQEETEGEEPKSDEEEGAEPELKEAQTVPPPVESEGEVKRLPNETPREYALRQEVTRLKRKGRDDQTRGLINQGPVFVKPEISPEKKKILERFKPEELSNLREVLDAVGEEMGFVRKDQLGATTYMEKANEELDAFLDSHKEYLPENDGDSILWDKFREEFALYKQPTNPKDFKKIFKKVHETVFGIKPTGELQKTNAAREKVKVASHSGASRSPSQGIRPQAAPGTGLRLDMLKGFSEEELSAMQGE